MKIKIRIEHIGGVMGSEELLELNEHVIHQSNQNQYDYIKLEIEKVIEKMKEKMVSRR